MAQQPGIMRFQAPRLLKSSETADSLAQWKNSFEVYITRDGNLAPFLTATWDPNDRNLGLVATETFTQIQMVANCKLFLAHFCSFLEHPYYNRRIQERSTSLKSIYLILEDIYQDILLSDSDVSKLKVRAVKLLKKSSSPKILVTKENKRIVLLVDEGSEINCLDADFAEKHDIRLEQTSSTAKAAGNRSLSVTGQTVDNLIVDTLFGSTHVPLNLGKATVIKNLGTEMILGEPGKATNSISTDPKNRIITVEREGKIMIKPYYDQKASVSHICRIQEAKLTVFPGESLELDVPDFLQNSEVALTPRRDYADMFQPRILSVGEIVKLKNISTLPITLKRHDQVADLQRTNWSEDISEEDKTSIHLVHHVDNDKFKFLPMAKRVQPSEIDKIQVDPQGQLDKEVRQQFAEINKQFEHIFTTTPGRYTGYYGDVDTTLQFVNKPVQNRKVAVPNYSVEMKQQMASKMDELIDAGVLMTPEEVGVLVEFISPSLLVPKPEPGAWRIVPDFTCLNKFIKRNTSTSPTIDEARQDLARKKYFAEVDLSNYFFQGGLRREDCSWLGVQHPYKGVFIYTASPQGLKNSSEFSYDRLGKVYGDMVQQGRMTRMADGLYPLGDTGQELLENYTEVLRRAENAGFTFKPSKTIIAPKSSVLFGWKLENRKWIPQDHVISSLSRTQRPVTVKQLRSFLGAYKQVAECIKEYSVLLNEFEKLVGSRPSSERLTWSEELNEAFERAKRKVAKIQKEYIYQRRMIEFSCFLTTQIRIRQLEALC